MKKLLTIVIAIITLTSCSDENTRAYNIDIKSFNLNNSVELKIGYNAQSFNDTTMIVSFSDLKEINSNRLITIERLKEMHPKTSPNLRQRTLGVEYKMAPVVYEVSNIYATPNRIFKTKSEALVYIHGINN